VIKLESAHIEEVRGVRKLDIDLGKETFAISGPNGSGKSGVIDAIEFGLTGRIGRLTGSGTKGLSVSEHGPHVDKTKFPDAAFVELKVFIPSLNTSATITRKISSPKKPKIVPDVSAVRAALTDIADHPEITLSRRDILRFILVEPTKRSEEIQTILKLEEIGDTRNALKTAQNRLQRTHETAVAQVHSSRETLQRHLQISTFQAADILAAVNERRKVLTLPTIEELTADTKLDAGLSETTKASEFNKQSTLLDLKALSERSVTFDDLGKPHAGVILAGISRLEADPALLNALHRHSFIEKGLDLIEGPECPLCGHSWDDERHLREHLTAKLTKSEEAGRLQEALLNAGSELAREAVRVLGIVGPVLKIADLQGEVGFARLLTDWKTNLEGLKASLTSLDGLIGQKDRLTLGWLEVPNAFAEGLARLTRNIEARPDQTTTLDSQTFLATAQLRLSDYREVARKNEAVKIASHSAMSAYDGYCRVMEDELNMLYDDVQEDFSTFYRMINEDDEVRFTARLSPSQGRLDFDVNFYDRGLFPPGAYHSEGHQDGMGVCLYLALMKRLFGDGFTIALLDDVVMSVDAGHRYQFCKLLKTHFPNTQFVITTHDRLWAEQMKSAGLVTAKTSIAFHSWTVETGPLVESNEEIWEEIEAALAKGKVEVAAAALRHHLEYVSRHLANNLGATAVFRADGNYGLGELLPAALTRMKSLLGKAADAAQSWGNVAAKEAVSSRKALLSSSNGAVNIEQWAVNKAVHYNEWANFGRKDFEPVVRAFKELLDCFRCSDCQSWLYVPPSPGPAESLRCSCGAVTMNLKPKPK
jgi:AAA domain